MPAGMRYIAEVNRIDLERNRHARRAKVCALFSSQGFMAGIALTTLSAYSALKGHHIDRSITEATGALTGFTEGVILHGMASRYGQKEAALEGALASHALAASLHLGLEVPVMQASPESPQS